jgi:hypothetical protein
MSPSQTIKSIIQNYPLAEVIRDYNISFALGGGDRETMLERLSILPQQERALALLGMLAYHQHATTGKGLHTFFYSCGAFAPEVLHALGDAGYIKRADVFGRAMALFGDVYPLDEAKRNAYFGYSHSEDLKAFDLNLLELSKQFADCGDLDRDLEEMVRREPALLAAMRLHAETIDERTRCEWLALQLWRLVDQDTSTASMNRFNAIPETIRGFMALTYFVWEASNGGLCQFFLNTSGNFAPEIPEALEQLELFESAEVLRRALSLFAAPYERDAETRREKYFCDHGSELQSALNLLARNLDTIKAEHHFSVAPLLHAQRHGLLPEIEAF